MKRTFPRLLALMLAVLMCLSFVACSTKPVEKDTTAASTQTEKPTEAPTEAPTEEQTTAATVDGLVIAENKTTEYTIVYSRMDGEYAQFAAEMLASKIKSVTGARIVVSVDTSPKGDKEIILGNTTREEALGFDREAHEWDTPLYVGLYDDSILITAKDSYRTFDNLNLIIDIWLASYEENGKLLFNEDTCNMMMNPPVDYTLNTLTMLSQNLYGFMGSGENTGAKRSERVLAQLKFYDPDIFSVNEQTKEWIPIFEQKAPEYGRLDDGPTGPNNIGQYNSIYYKLDKFLVEDSGNIRNGAQGDAEGTQYDRIITWAMFRIKTTGQRFFYVSTHLDTASDEVRTKEAVRVLTLIKEKAGDNVPVFMAGDMNATMTSGCYKTLTAYFDDVRTVADINLSAGATTHLNMDTGASGALIDYHFVKKGSGVQSYYFKVINERKFGDYVLPLGSYTSDHYALFSKHNLG